MGRMTGVFNRRRLYGNLFGSLRGNKQPRFRVYLRADGDGIEILLSQFCPMSWVPIHNQEYHVVGSMNKAF